MSQLNVYVPDKIERQIRQKAKKLGKSISRFLTDMLTKQITPQSEWDKGFFTHVVGKWHGDFPRINRDKPEERNGL